VHAGDRPDLASVAEAVRATAEHRALLEQAKGALRYLLDADEGQAFTQLAQRARATRAPVTEVAREVMETNTAGRRPDRLPDA
jgi:AmiR/NasT family two-component response regulator